MRPIGQATDREVVAFRMHQNGSTYAEIGRHLGVSRAMASVLAKSCHRRVVISLSCPAHAAPKFLGVRVVGALLNHEIDIKDQDAHYAASRLKSWEVQRWPNVHKGGLRQIKDWLAYNNLSLIYPEKPKPPQELITCPHCGTTI